MRMSINDTELTCSEQETWAELTAQNAERNARIEKIRKEHALTELLGITVIKQLVVSNV